MADYAAGVRGPKFHNSSTYINWGCRCEICVLDMQRVNRVTTDRHAVLRRMAREDRERERDEARDP